MIGSLKTKTKTRTGRLKMHNMQGLSMNAGWRQYGVKAFDWSHLSQTQQDGTVEATGNDSDDDMGFRMLLSLILLWLWLAFASKILDLCRGVRLLGSEIGNFAPQKVEHKELKADETDENWICPLPFSDSSYFYDQNSSRWSTWLTSTNAMLLTIRRTCLFRPVVTPVMSKKLLNFLHICQSCMIQYDSWRRLMARPGPLKLDALAKSSFVRPNS